MKAIDIMNHFQEIATWVDWSDTNDVFLYGDPEVEVKGIAVTWIPSNDTLKKAAVKGCNIVITHEPAFYKFYYEHPDSLTIDKAIEKKKALLDDLGITLLRCHDTLDRMPKVGIVDKWAELFEFDMEERLVESFYKVCLVDGLSVSEVAEIIKEKVRPLGENNLLICGDKNKKIKRMVVGTGAITFFPAMYDLGADLILATDDGIQTWTAGLMSVELNTPMIILNHATAEKPGMMALADYLKEKYPEIAIEYLDVEFPYQSV